MDTSKVLYIRKGFLFLFMLFFSFSFAYAVEEFSTYDTKISIIDDETLEVSKKINLRNIHDVGIVPGQVEFKIYHGEGSGVLAISEYTVRDRYNNEIKNSEFSTGNYTVILLDIFTPVLPGFEYIINLNYTITYDSSGIFFKSVQVPLLEETRIPIRSGTVEVTLPDGKDFTYLSYEDENTIVEGGNALLELSSTVPNQLQIEYSYFPIHIKGVRGSILFWLIINVILLIILGVEIRKEVKRRE